MEKVALGPALELPPVAEPFPIDLGAYQRRVMAQLQADQERLAQLEQEHATLIARIHGARGKLDLIAEIALGLDKGQVGRGGRPNDVESRNTPGT